MKRMVKLFEEFKQSPEYIITSLFDKLEILINNWYNDNEEDNISGLEGLSINKTIGSGNDYSIFSIVFEFEEYSYSIDLNVELPEENIDEITTCKKISKKISEDSDVISEYEEDINPNEFTIDSIIKTITELDTLKEDN